MKFAKPLRAVYKVFLHCSASDRASHDDIKVIRKWHKERGFSDVGYHFFIKKDGAVQVGRPLSKIPAAQKGHNTGSIAICLSGLSIEKFTTEQKESLIDLCHQINAAYDTISFHGHKEVANKLCPVFDYKDWLNLDSKGFIKIKEKNMKGFKTVIFNILAAIVPVLEVSGADLGLSGQALAIYGLGVTIANLVLRFFTNTSIGRAE